MNFAATAADLLSWGKDHIAQVVVVPVVAAWALALGVMKYKGYRKERREAMAIVALVPDPKPVVLPPHAPRA